MYKLNVEDDTIHKHLEINTDNPYAFEKTLKEHAHLEADYTRAYAKAQREVDDLTFQLELTTAEIVEDLKTKSEKAIPASGWAELRRVQAVLDPEYIKVREDLIKATETLNILKGFVEAFGSRGYRLLEIAKIQERLMQGPLRSYEDKLDKAGEALST
jgi:hypothetical protein